jgi:hypothetical protein
LINPFEFITPVPWKSPFTAFGNLKKTYWEKYCKSHTLHLLDTRLKLETAGLARGAKAVSFLLTMMHLHPYYKN